jgi:hypothetical protein
MASIFFGDNGVKKNSVIVTPSYIKSKLFSFHAAAHSLHLDCAGENSFAEHKALDKLYKELEDVKDDIVEQLQGYLGNRIGAVSLDPIPTYTKGQSLVLVNQIIEFCGQVSEYAEQRKMYGVEAAIQDFEGTVAQVKFLLSLC